MKKYVGILLITALFLAACGSGSPLSISFIGHSNARLLVKHGDFGNNIIIDKSDPAHTSEWHTGLYDNFIADNKYYDRIIFFVPAMYSYLDVTPDMFMNLTENFKYGEITFIPSWCGRGDDEYVWQLIQDMAAVYPRVSAIDIKDIETVDGCHYEPEDYLEISKRIHIR